MKMTKIPKVAFGLLMTAVLLFAATAQADLPSLISYQGKLADADGAPVADGDYTFDVKLGTEDGSTIVFESGALVVPVADGLYALEIGPVVDLLGLAVNDVYLHLAVGDETFPPVPLNSVPYALLSSWAASVADGSISASSLDAGLTTSIALVDTNADMLDMVKADIAVDGDFTIGELVNALRATTQPIWTSKTNYIIDLGTPLNKVNAFAFAGPSLMNPQNGTPANRPAITINGALPDGLGYDASIDRLFGTPTAEGIFPLTLVATDFLGQTVSQDVTIEVIDITMGDILGEIVDGLNDGPFSSGDDDIIIAGDTITLTQEISGDTDKIVGFPFTWDVPALVSSSDIMTDGPVLMDEAMVFTTGLPGMPTTNHEGFYSTSLMLDFMQVVPGDTFEIGDIDPAFSLDDLLYDGIDDVDFSIEVAGSDTEDLSITANLFPGFNGTAMFQWYVARADDDAPNSVRAIDGAVLQNFAVEDLIQILDEDGLARQNGGSHPLPNYGEDQSFYFAAVSNGFADLATANPPYWTTQPGTVEIRVNDNINIADEPDNRTEYDGYSLGFGVVAGTTNFVGDLSYFWSTTNGFGTSVGPTSDGNAYIVPGDVFNSNQDPYRIGVTVTSTDDGVDLAKETTSATVTVIPAILAVPSGIDVVFDPSADVASPVIPDSTPDAYFGIYSPNDDIDPLTETVELNETVVFQVIVWVPEAINSDQDDGEFVDFLTGPNRDLSVVWKFDPDGGGEVITIPVTNVSDPEYFQVNPAGLNRVGVRWFMTLENVQLINNNVADGKFWAEVSSPTGTFRSPNADLTVDLD